MLLWFQLLLLETNQSISKAVLRANKQTTPKKATCTEITVDYLSQVSAGVSVVAEIAERAGPCC